jgi:hypothetical protein
LAAISENASSHEIGTNPGSASRAFTGLVRFIGCSTRFGLYVFCTSPNALTQTLPPPGWIAAAQKFGSTSVAMPSSTLTVSRSGPATHW